MPESTDDLLRRKQGKEPRREVALTDASVADHLAAMQDGDVRLVADTSKENPNDAD